MRRASWQLLQSMAEFGMCMAGRQWTCCPANMGGAATRGCGSASDILAAMIALPVKHVWHCPVRTTPLRAGNNTGVFRLRTPRSTCWCLP